MVLRVLQLQTEQDSTYQKVNLRAQNYGNVYLHHLSLIAADRANELLAVKDKTIDIKRAPIFGSRMKRPLQDITNTLQSPNQ
jgi:hypothetical protein